VFADGGGYDKYRRLVWAKYIKPRIARRGTEQGSGLGGALGDRAHHRLVPRHVPLAYPI
jgi:hypothetical protein